MCQKGGLLMEFILGCTDYVDVADYMRDNIVV